MTNGAGRPLETLGDPPAVVPAMKTLSLACVLLWGGVLSAPAAQPSAPASPVHSELGVMIPMRDGVKLAADVWLPEAPGRCPVLLVRTPYDEDGFQAGQWAAYFASRGYVFAVQDTRGRGDSEGTFDPFFGEGRDGYDTVEWLAKQPWSNGRVGMLGLSYLGTAQWLAAREHPPHLACMAPTAWPAAGSRSFPTWAVPSPSWSRSPLPTKSPAASTRRLRWQRRRDQARRRHRPCREAASNQRPAEAVGAVRPGAADARARPATARAR